MINTQLFFLFLLVVQTVSPNVRTLYLSKFNDRKYQCNTSGCSPSTILSTSNVQNCEIACLNDQQCRTLTYSSNTHQCQIFVDIPSEYGNLSTNTGSITMIAIGERQLSTRKWNNIQRKRDYTHSLV